MRIVMAILLALTIPTALVATPAKTQNLLKEARLKEAIDLLKQQIQENDRDDTARFELGMVRFLAAFERFCQQLYRHGLGGNRLPLTMLFGLPPNLDLPNNRDPETISYIKLRGIVQRFVTDMDEAQKGLQAIQDPNVKVTLKPFLIDLDLTGKGIVFWSANHFLQGMAGGAGARNANQASEKFQITFDRGDVCWLRGYCHFLAGLGEWLLCVDGKEGFETCAHRFFAKVETPHAYLQNEPNLPGNNNFFGPNFIRELSDVFALIHQLRMEVKEPARCKAALEHFQETLALSQEMWKFILAETDDDNEWIPNPKQKGPGGASITQPMIDTWLDTVKECQALLEGKKLIPFWRGDNAKRGVNIRKVFLEPRNFDFVLWFQGTAATPYLQDELPLTLFSAAELPGRINNIFGGNFPFFAFWFN